MGLMGSAPPIAGADSERLFAADAARGHFASWEEYGRSFAFGRGVWHGDEDDCQIAWEIVTTLLEEETSPWRHIHWNA